MVVTYTVIIAISAFFFALLGTAGLVLLLPKISMLDMPEDRSNHSEPTPRGGGIAVMVTVIGFLMVVSAEANLLLGAIALGIISLMDDVKSQPVRIRLGVQFMAVIAVLVTMPGDVFQGLLPWWLDKMVAGLIWVWFMNLYNFMDGIDEITSVETTTICTGLIFLTLSTALPGYVALDALIIFMAMLGFWVFNRHPAKIFLGDVGSIPLGFIIGYLLLILAMHGYWHAALILPAYYLTDATITLIKRYLHGEKIYEAHSEHAYQQAVRHGRSHREVSEFILGLNMVLVVLAVATILGGWVPSAALGVAYLLAFALRTVLKSPPAKVFIPRHA